MLQLLLLNLLIYSVWCKSGCESPKLLQHAEPLEPPLRFYPEKAKFYYKCTTDYNFEDSINRSNNDEKRKVICQHGVWEPALTRCVDLCGNKCGAHGTCTNTLAREPFCSCKTNFAGEKCNKRVCDLQTYMLNPEHGNLMLTGKVENGKYSVGSKLTIKCDSNYEPVDDKAIYECKDGGWSNSNRPVCQAKRCSSNNVVDLIYTPHHSKYIQGSTVTFMCPPHKQLVGVPSVLCNSDGKWSSAWPSCKSLRCPEAPTIQNAYKIKKPYYVNDRVVYTCNPGYTMVGVSESLTCNDQLRWIGTGPMCYSKREFQRYCERQNKYMTRDKGSYVCAAKGNQEGASTTTKMSTKASMKPLTIVTATAGGLLLLLLMVIILVACQRRRLARLNRMNRHARLNNDDERYSFVYYSNDVHVVLPSYDEAMGTHRRAQPPPYVSEENGNELNAPTAGGDGVEHAVEENVYESMDDILPNRNGSSNSLQRLSSLTETTDEPVYAIIRRVLLSGTSQRTPSQEESASTTTLNSNTETASIVTAASNEDNTSTNNVYHMEERSSPGPMTNEALEETESVSSADLCIGDEDDVPLLNN